MLSEKEYQERLDRIQALRERLADQLSGSLVSNPALAEELNGQIDALVDAADRCRRRRGPSRPTADSLRWSASARTRPDLRRDPHLARRRAVRRAGQLRTDRRGRRPLLHLPARADRGLQGRAEAQAALRGRRGAALGRAGRLPALPVRPSRRAALHPARTGSTPTGGCSATGAGSAPARAARTPTSTCCSATSSTRSRCSGATSGSRTSSASVPSTRASARSRSSAAPGLDLRNNLKFTSFGHLNVMRVELMQVLEECFRILGSPDVMDLFGADNAWDVVDEVLIRYFDERLQSSPRQRMAVTGREVLRWLSGPHILETGRGEFEALLMDIAEPAEEWLTSAQAMSLARRTGSDRVLPWEQLGQSGIAVPGGRAQPADGAAVRSHNLAADAAARSIPARRSRDLPRWALGAATDAVRDGESGGLAGSGLRARAARRSLPAGARRRWRTGCAIPSVSGDPAHRGTWSAQQRRCAPAAHDDPAGPDRGRGRAVRSCSHGSTAGPDARGRPAVVVYGHLDVTPAGPGWSSPPFRPTRLGRRLVARGASDDKGQLMAHLVALQAWARRRRSTVRRRRDRRRCRGDR